MDMRLATLHEYDLGACVERFAADVVEVECQLRCCQGVTESTGCIAQLVLLNQGLHFAQDFSKLREVCQERWTCSLAIILDEGVEFCLGNFRHTVLIVNRKITLER